VTVPIWFVYVIHSATSGKLYTGISTSPRRRLVQHNGTSSGLGAKATRAGRPWRLVHTEPMDSKSDALKREHAIKRLTRAQKLKLVGLS
jgi:putative endonuclease